VNFQWFEWVTGIRDEIINENAKNLVATFSHDFVPNIYTLIDQDGEGDDYTLEELPMQTGYFLKTHLTANAEVPAAKTAFLTICGGTLNSRDQKSRACSS